MYINISISEAPSPYKRLQATTNTMWVDLFVIVYILGTLDHRVAILLHYNTISARSTVSTPAGGGRGVPERVLRGAALQALREGWDLWRGVGRLRDVRQLTHDHGGRLNMALAAAASVALEGKEGEGGHY